MKIERLQRDELELLIKSLDEEFIQSRGRSVSLKDRFPKVFCQGQVKNIFVLRNGDTICSTVTAYPFSYQAPTGIVKGVMIGLVYTSPIYRGKGFAGHLLEHVVSHFASETDFAALWTGIHHFYERLGWVLADSGVFGVCEGSYFQQRADQPVPFDAVHIEGLQRLRSQILTEGVIRSAPDFLSLPIPAEAMDYFFLGQPEKPEAYALVGRQGSTGYLYEIIAMEEHFSHIWASVLARYQKVMINEKEHSPFYSWLSKNASIDWVKQEQSMWLDFSGRGVADRYISYLDRI